MTLHRVPSLGPQSLPGSCPSWCPSGPEGHRQAYDEIGDEDPTAASLHLSVDTCFRLEDLIQPTTRQVLRSGGVSWGIRLEADHVEHWHGYPFVVMEVGSTGKDKEELRLTSGEARVLARQLVHFADQIDLEAI